MMNDPLVEEIRRHRKEHAAQYGNDLARIAAALKEKERASGKRYLNPGPKRLPERRAAQSTGGGNVVQAEYGGGTRKSERKKPKKKDKPVE